MSAPLVFVDVETTGLGPEDEVWEVALIRRDPGLPDRELHLFVEHDTAKAAHLPDDMRKDHEIRFLPDLAISRRDAGRLIYRHIAAPEGDQGARQPHLVGVNPAFDAEHLRRLIPSGPDSRPEPWHYHLIDVLPLAAGYLLGQAVQKWGDTHVDDPEIVRKHSLRPKTPTDAKHEKRPLAQEAAS